MTQIHKTLNYLRKLVPKSYYTIIIKVNFGRKGYTETKFTSIHDKPFLELLPDGEEGEGQNGPSYLKSMISIWQLYNLGHLYLNKENP